MSSRRRPSSRPIDRFTEATWLLPAVFAGYRAPVRLDRPELRAAYDRGVADRIAGARPDHVFTDDLQAAQAYGEGRRQVVAAPLPWSLEALRFGQVVGLGLLGESWRDRRASRAILVLGTAGTLAVGSAVDSAGLRRSAASNLTPLTAPRVSWHSLRLVLALAIVRWAYDIRARWRTGRWPRPVEPWERALARDVALVFVRRRAWRRALRVARHELSTGA
jgi:hypothetical protein